MDAVKRVLPHNLVDHAARMLEQSPLAFDGYGLIVSSGVYDLRALYVGGACLKIFSLLCVHAIAGAPPSAPGEGAPPCYRCYSVSVAVGTRRPTTPKLRHTSGPRR